MRYAEDYSGYGNEILYRMCREKPRHKDIDTVKSKLWLIGRAYSAAIERKAGSQFKIDDAANILINSEIDTHINRLLKINRIDDKNLELLLQAHKALTDSLKEATGIDKRSLASKYLHFHAPKAVFIYDSIANSKIRLLLNPLQRRFKCNKKYDLPYEGFVRRCLHFRDFVYENQIGALATPRKIDMYLIGMTTI